MLSGVNWVLFNMPQNFDTLFLVEPARQGIRQNFEAC